MALYLQAANDLVRPAECDEVEPREEYRGDEDRCPDRLTEGGPDTFTAGHDCETDPEDGPANERQPIRPPGFHS